MGTEHDEHEHDEHGHVWDDMAKDWDDQEGVVAYAGAAFDSLLAVLDGHRRSLAGANVIDFGCGTGQMTERLVAAGASVLAVDTARSMLDVLDQKIIEHGWPNVSTSQNLPMPEQACQLVVCSSVCSFLPDYPATVRDLVAHLGADGLFVQWDWERVAGEDGGLSRDEINHALSAAGLDDIVVDVGFRLKFGDEEMAPLIGHGRKPAASS